MRTIKFRGKRLDGGGWITGYYVKELNPYIKDTEEIDAIITKAGDYEVLPESVGQWTGLVDKNGKEIFEGDICRFKEWEHGEFCWFGLVSFDYCLYLLRGGCNEESDCNFEIQLSRIPSERIEIIGNLIDSPELMEVE